MGVQTVPSPPEQTLAKAQLQLPPLEQLASQLPAQSGQASPGPLPVQPASTGTSDWAAWPSPSQALPPCPAFQATLSAPSGFSPSAAPLTGALGELATGTAFGSLMGASLLGAPLLGTQVPD